MSAPIVSDAVSRLLVSRVTAPITASRSVPRLELRPTTFFAHTDAVDARQPRWQPYTCPQRHANSFGARPSDGRSHLRMLSWNVDGTSKVCPHPRWYMLSKEIQEVKPNILALFQCTTVETWQLFTSNPAFQYLFAATSLPEWEKQIGGDSTERGGPILALNKQLLGQGTKVGWARFEHDASEDSATDKRGITVVDIASRGIPTMRVAAAQFDQAYDDSGFARRETQYMQAMDLFTRLDAEQPLPTVLMGDLGPSPTEEHLSPLFSTPQAFQDVALAIARRGSELDTLNVTQPFVPLKGDGDEHPRLVRQTPSRPDRILVSAPSDRTPAFVDARRTWTVGNERCISKSEHQWVAMGKDPNYLIKTRKLMHRLGRDGYVYPSSHLGVVVEGFLEYREGSKELELLERLEGGRAMSEARRRDVPGNVKDTAPALRKAALEQDLPRKVGEPFANRAGGRPVPIANWKKKVAKRRGVILK